MKIIAGLTVLALTLLVGCTAMPDSAGKEGDPHGAHHPGSPATMSAPAGYDQQMKMMQEMHQKMAAAKTPDERAALMKEHRKTMHDGMGMMGQMRGGMMGGKRMESGAGPMAMDPEMMKRRMDMMDMMMQMMVDREETMPPMAK